MKYRRLGATGIQVSEIGFGTWGLGGDAYGPVTDGTSQATLHLALELGITFFDTSDLYGNGHSEEVLGKAFEHCRDRVTIATKVGMLPHAGFYMPQDFSATHIRAGIDASLRRLRTDYIDLYLLHSPPIDLDNWPEVTTTLGSLQKEGKIRAAGISARSPADALIAVQRFGFPAIQVNFNMIDQRAVDIGLFELCRRQNVGVMARTPLAFGYLAGTLSGDEELPLGDHRAKWPRAQLRRWADAPRLFAPLNEGKQRCMAQLALQFCLSERAVSTVIPGIMTLDEVRKNAGAADLPTLTKDELSAIRKIYRDHEFYDATAKSATAAR